MGSAPTSRPHFWPRLGPWLGLALLVAGVILILFPLLPAAALGGAAPQGAPHLPWAATGAVVLGVIVLLWQRRQDG